MAREGNLPGMRPFPIAAIRRDRLLRARRVAFTVDSELGAIILRMIASNSLSAFTLAIGQKQTVQPVHSTSPAQAGAAPGPTTAQPRLLDAVPPQPARPLPRGSLLDLRV
mgnify:CR=1 FL=1